MSEPSEEAKHERIRNLAEQLKTADPTTGNLEGVLSVAVLDLLAELAALREQVEAAKRMACHARSIHDQCLLPNARLDEALRLIEVWEFAALPGPSTPEPPHE